MGSGLERAWRIGVWQSVSKCGIALQKRQQAGALQTLRDLGGTVRNRGSADSPVACCCCVKIALSRRTHAQAGP